MSGTTDEELAELFESFDVPDDVAVLPATAASELEMMIIAEGDDEDQSILAGAKPVFDPEAKRFQSWAVAGNTYDVKDQLKALGCRFNGDRRCWVAYNEEMYKAACAIRDGQRGGTLLNAAKKPGRSRCAVVVQQPALPIQPPAPPATVPGSHGNYVVAGIPTPVPALAAKLSALKRASNLELMTELVTRMERDGAKVERLVPQLETRLVHGLKELGYKVEAIPMAERLENAGVDLNEVDRVFETEESGE